MLTASLEKAFAEASKLEEDEQNALAAWIIREIDSERRWTKTFSDSSDELARLAEEALLGTTTKQGAQPNQRTKPGP